MPAYYPVSGRAVSSQRNYATSPTACALDGQRSEAGGAFRLAPPALSVLHGLIVVLFGRVTLGRGTDGDHGGERRWIARRERIFRHLVHGVGGRRFRRTRWFRAGRRDGEPFKGSMGAHAYLLCCGIIG